MTALREPEARIPGFGRFLGFDEYSKFRMSEFRGPQFLAVENGDWIFEGGGG